VTAATQTQAGDAATKEVDFALINLAFCAVATSQLHKTRDVFKTKYFSKTVSGSLVFG